MSNVIINKSYQFVINDTLIPFNLKDFSDKNNILQIIGTTPTGFIYYEPFNEKFSNLTILQPLSTYLVISRTYPYEIRFDNTPTPTPTPFPTSTPTPTPT